MASTPARGARASSSVTASAGVIDGPFTETKELVAGYWLWQVKSIDEAIEWVKRIPNPDPGVESIVEIRPVFESDDFGDELTPELREKEQRLRRQTKGTQ
jgi:hypothetical protein